MKNKQEAINYQKLLEASWVKTAKSLSLIMDLLTVMSAHTDLDITEYKDRARDLGIAI